MTALQPTLVAYSPEGSRQQFTPPPQHILPAAAVEAVQVRPCLRMVWFQFVMQMLMVMMRMIKLLIVLTECVCKKDAYGSDAVLAVVGELATADAL